MVGDTRNDFIVSVFEAKGAGGFRGVEGSVSTFGYENLQGIIEASRHKEAICDPMESGFKDPGSTEADHEVGEIWDAISSRSGVSDTTKMIDDAMGGGGSNVSEIPSYTVIFDEALRST